MKIKTITVGRVKNLGNYESSRMELVAELVEGDNVLESIERLSNTVYYKLNEADNEAKVESNNKIVASDTHSEEAKEKALDYNKRYQAFKEEVENQDFINV